MLFSNCFTSMLYPVKQILTSQKQNNHTFSLPKTWYYIMLHKPTENFIEENKCYIHLISNAFSEVFFLQLGQPIESRYWQIESSFGKPKQKHHI